MTTRFGWIHYLFYASSWSGSGILPKSDTGFFVFLVYSSNQIHPNVRQSVISSFPHYGHSGIVEAARDLFNQVEGNAGAGGKDMTCSSTLLKIVELPFCHIILTSYKLNIFSHLESFLDAPIVILDGISLSYFYILCIQVHASLFFNNPHK